MVKEYEPNNSLCTNVMLKDGTLFSGKDITTQPMGENGEIVSFWHNGVVRAYFKENVEYVEFYNKEDA